MDETTAPNPSTPPSNPQPDQGPPPSPPSTDDKANESANDAGTPPPAAEEKKASELPPPNGEYHMQRHPDGSDSVNCDGEWVKIPDGTRPMFEMAAKHGVPLQRALARVDDMIADLKKD